MKPEILLTAPVEPRLQADLEAVYRVHRLWEAADKPAFLAAIGKGVRGVVTRSVIGADEALMAALPGLEIIAVFGVGTDAVDLAAARDRAVRVANTPGVLTEDTADYGIGLLLALARRIVEGDRYVRAGKWPAGLLANSTRVHGKKLGIVGLGRIGSAVARRAQAFGMDIRYNGPRAKPVSAWTHVPDLAALAAQVDFLILTCPGGPQTAGIVNREVLAALGPEGMLVNIARASVIDEKALVTALETGAIKAAALDVFADEPNVPEALLAMDNVIVEPHIASTTVETRMAICDLVLANLAAHFAGRTPPGLVG
ncbi:2-hydroxyacid dehydrogenase [Nitratireductor soli]|uniref:2-hydroxyacid dehydrogenase n=1 Tax=Nitratireductor soli TaxID=1670619 RepID=UPI00065DDE98|nr:2-hydroxyacid dehydrogenase [Nitratireductor soli]